VRAANALELQVSCNFLPTLEERLVALVGRHRRRRLINKLLRPDLCIVDGTIFCSSVSSVSYVVYSIGLFLTVKDV